jgi:hypothetical protein
MRSLRVTLAAALCAAVPFVPSLASVAAAQKDPGKPKMAPIDPDAEVKPPSERAERAEGADGDKGEGTDVEMEEDAPPEDMEGTSENPDAPRQVGDDTAVATTAPAATRVGYPIEDVLRPITLPAVTSEIGLDVRSTFDSLDTSLGLRARYGITRQIQVGLRYGIGGLYNDIEDASDSAVFNTGKAVGLDVTYLIKDWVAAKITLPVYVQPFAMAVTLGAPMKFRFGQRFAIVALDDFLDIRLTKFIPSLTDERYNELAVAAVETETSRPSALIHIRAGVIYQLKPKMAIKGNVTQTIVQGTNEAFSSSKSPFGLEGLLEYTVSPKMDVTGRIGIDAFDSASETFGLMVAAAYRI